MNLSLLFFIILFHLSDCNLIICDKSCNKANTSTVNKALQDYCCNENVKQRSYPLGRPPPPPLEVSVGWYIPENVSGSCGNVALDITWEDSVQTALSNESEGYSVVIVRRSSVVSHKIWIKLDKLLISQSSERGEKHDLFVTSREKCVKISLNYKQDYQTTDVPILPGYLYFVEVSSLPVNNDENIEPPSCCHEQIDIPDCNSNTSVKSSCYCKLKTSDSAPTSSTQRHTKTPFTGPVATKHPFSSTSLIVIVSVFVLIFVAALCFFIFLSSMWMRRKTGTQCPPRKIFVSISCEDADRSSWQSVAADQMCCFFQQHGSEVTYTLWHSTQLTQTNTIQWVCDEMEKNDHVILVLTPRALQQDAEWSETDPLLNRAYDPYRIVRKKMEAGGNNFSIVYFDPHLNIPPSLSCIKSCYQLPKDSVRLCRHLLDCDVSAGRLLERSLVKKCGSVTSSLSVHSEGGSEVCEVPLLVTWKQPSVGDEQADSGYLTNLEH